ncbi:Aminomethyltransferase folate-binding domain-containing protein [Trematosphaeria pertusa]|uniref:Iron-sulfur cluster assembly factor IBA57 homolog, mitochondrial n=1 Tax=Trematosphaeria pertusa TaxID=390896 RepID=A0A6A6IN04_9PLEO|nr:Aminomethyltransferase folate-binding domain-containing protein [Trematosphaeria pertusa]KAF2251478.1 Aminomethyltransferase folate-binding domain-containing protein [Trematosphaeria pertusa]
MAAILPASWSRAAPFICDSCLSRSLRALQPTAPRFLTTASSQRLSSLQRPTQFHRKASSTAIPIIRSRPFEALALRRQNSSTRLLPRSASSGIAPLPSCRLISLSGPDTAKFLQGLVTNNVDPHRRAPFYSAFLDARGRVLWDAFIWVDLELMEKEGNWACYIEVDAEEVEALVKHLRRHKLRSKVNIAVVGESEMGVWAGWGVSPEQLQSERLVASLVDPRGRNFGVRCLFKGNEAPENPPVPVVDALQYRLRRYLFGIPEGPQEIQRESALPMECNIDLSQGIDFRKGCYVGQELTIRTKHTGVVRKRILPVQLYHTTPPPDYDHRDPNTLPNFDPNWGDDLPESGADIKQLDEEGSIRKGRAAGKFITGIGNVGLALCRLEMMTSMRISAEGGSWKPGVEFGIQKGADGEVIRVKAIVPQWFRERERDMWDKNRTRV